MYNQHEQESTRYEAQPGQYGSDQYGHDIAKAGGILSGGVLTFTLGALFGGMVAILLAPENARQRLRQGAGNLLHTDALKERASMLKHQGRAVKDAFQTARETYQTELERSRNEGIESGSPINRNPGPSGQNPRP
jgi:hypothetical protein